MWRPLMAQSPLVRQIRIKLEDSGEPSLAASQNFWVTVNAPARLVMGLVDMSNEVFRFTVSGDAGPDYGVFASTNLVDWLLLQQTNSPLLPFHFDDPAATNFNQRFYRIQLLP